MFQRGRRIVFRDQEIRIRPLVALDVDNVDSLEGTVFGEDRWSLEMIEATIAHPDTRLFVAEVARDGHINFAGYCALYLDGSEVVVTTIGVDEKFRRIGVGRAMTRTLVNEATSLGASLVCLNLRTDNFGAKKLYESLGFKLVGITKGYYESDGADAEMMELRL
jgi:ribosomal-protein-alanine N-acetyltransferase